MNTAALVPSVLRRQLRWFSLKPIEDDTADGRARERHRRMALSSAAAALAKLLSVSTALISIPLTLHYLGAERFGMWMTISSLIAMLAFADFGIANGVLGEVADAHGKGDLHALQRVVSSGFVMLGSIAVGLLVAFAALYPFIPWPRVFNVVGDAARAEAGPAIAVFVACFAVAIPLSIVQRVQMGLQQSFLASLWQCVGSVLALVGVLLAIQVQAGLGWLVLSLAGAPLLAALLNSAHFFGRQRPELKPRIALMSRAAARKLAKAGGLFFVLQITVAVAYTSDSIVIAQLLGPAAVAAYAVPEKLFALVTVALSLVLAPLWPAYGEALVRGDRDWVRSTLRRSLLVAVSLGGGASLLLLAFGPSILRHWVGNMVDVPLLLLLAFAIWKLVESAGTAVAMYLNGAQVIRLQVLCAIPTAVTAILLKIWLVQRIGVAGAVFASIVAYLVFTALPISMKLPSLLRDGRPQ